MAIDCRAFQHQASPYTLLPASKKGNNIPFATDLTTTVIKFNVQNSKVKIQKPKFPPNLTEERKSRRYLQPTNIQRVTFLPD